LFIFDPLVKIVGASPLFQDIMIYYLFGVGLVKWVNTKFVQLCWICYLL